MQVCISKAYPFLKFFKYKNSTLVVCDSRGQKQENSLIQLVAVGLGMLAISFLSLAFVKKKMKKNLSIFDGLSPATRDAFEKKKARQRERANDQRVYTWGLLSFPP